MSSSQTAGDRDRLSQQLHDTDAALDQARQDHRAAAADIERLTEREAELTSQLADVQSDRNTLECQLAEAKKAIADAESALRDAQQRHDAALAAAATELAERQAQFDRELTEDRRRSRPPRAAVERH